MWPEAAGPTLTHLGYEDEGGGVYRHDYVLSNVADAGFRRVCLVVGPKHGELQDYYRRQVRERLDITFAVQAEPLGTAGAVLAAAEFSGDDSFLAINSDNCYPATALRSRMALSNSNSRR